VLIHFINIHYYISTFLRGKPAVKHTTSFLISVSMPVRGFPCENGPSDKRLSFYLSVESLPRVAAPSGHIYDDDNNNDDDDDDDDNDDR
jgi:hypothetical protein